MHTSRDNVSDRTGNGQSTLELIASRQQTSSTPSDRRDGSRLALVIEGGGNRAAYSAGMAMTLSRAGLIQCFDAIYGTSGGALNGAWILTDTGLDALRLWASPAYAAERVADIRRLLRGKAVLDLNHLLHHVYVNVFPMDFHAILSSAVPLHPVATCAATGRAVDLAPLIRDVPSLQTTLKATAALPLLAGRPIMIEGQRYIDGGVAEPIPVHQALEQGATHVLVLRTRRCDQNVQAPSRRERMVMVPWFAAYAPGARHAYLNRHLRHAHDEDLLATDPRIVQLRPPVGSLDVSRLTTECSVIAEALTLGARAATDALESAGIPTVTPPC